MTDKLVEVILWVASICGGLYTIYSFASVFSRPFKESTQKFEETLQATNRAIEGLQRLVDKLSYTLEASNKDIENIHQTLEDHDDSIKSIVTEVAINKAEIKNIYHKLKEK